MTISSLASGIGILNATWRLVGLCRILGSKDKDDQITPVQFEQRQRPRQRNRYFCEGTRLTLPPIHERTRAVAETHTRGDRNWHTLDTWRAHWKSRATCSCCSEEARKKDADEMAHARGYPER